MTHDEIQKALDEIVVGYDLAAILQSSHKCENDLPIVAITCLDGSMPDRLLAKELSDKIANQLPVSRVVLGMSDGRSKVELFKENESLMAQLNELKSKLELCRKKLRGTNQTINSYQRTINRQAMYDADYLPYHEDEREYEGD